MNLSQICDAYLRELVREELERSWREEHADFIAAYNACIDAEGLPLNEWEKLLMARFDVYPNPGQRGDSAT